MIRKRFVCVLAAGALAVLGAKAGALETLIEEVEKGCAKELKSYCSQVTPGQGRVLACLYAHGDKLSGSCEFALYDAAVQLERAVAAMSYAANECDADIDKYCAAVALGEGRLLKCLADNKISARCKEALSVTGLQ